MNSANQEVQMSKGLPTHADKNLASTWSDKARTTSNHLARFIKRAKREWVEQKLKEVEMNGIWEVNQ